MGHNVLPEIPHSFHISTEREKAAGSQLQEMAEKANVPAGRFSHTTRTGVVYHEVLAEVEAWGLISLWLDRIVHPAPLGTNSSINPGASCPSACATGPMGSDQRELVLGGREETGEKIRTALERAGIEFIEENGGGAGVRLRKAKWRAK